MYNLNTTVQPMYLLPTINSPLVIKGKTYDCLTKNSQEKTVPITQLFLYFARCLVNVVFGMGLRTINLVV